MHTGRTSTGKKPASLTLPVTLLVVSTALGIAAWLLPEPLQLVAAIAAIVAAVLGLMARADRLRKFVRSALAAMAAAAFAGLLVGLILAGDWLRLTVLLPMPFIWFQWTRQARGLPAEENHWWQRRSLIRAQLASLLERAESQADSIRLLTENKNRRSSILRFWGGVALSIPIGVVINLATG